MTFQVRFVKANAPLYAFDTAPFVVPDHTYEYDLSLPPRLIAIDKLWTLEGVLYGNGAAAVSAAWDALKAKIEDPKNYPDGIELVRDGTVFESISVAGGYDDWRIQRLASPKTDLQWRGELRFTLKILGRRRIPGLTSPITKFTQTETWAYDEAGLLTRTLAGELEVASGSATAQARTFGLKVPDNTFGVVTNGPEGVDVERLDPADLKARYTSTIKQSGTPLPDGCAPNFTVDVETSVQNGLQTTTTRVHATGTGALAAVQSHLAPGRVHETVSQDANTRSAQGVFVEVRPASGNQLLRLQRFSVSGGNRPIAFTRRTGGRPPADHTLAYTAVTVIETIELVTWGKPATASIMLPSPVTGLPEDRDAWHLVGPERTLIGKDATSDEWTTHVTRVYRAASLANLFTPVLQSISVPGAGTSLDDEITRITKV
ncbi:MAG TPA: hypothetical protein VFF73_38065 [Planctomycetota bacterium]|nr:hypothetical protein [Planctomycetota bacterium]